MHEGSDVPMLFSLCNVLGTVLLGDKIAATVGIKDAASESRTIRKIVHWIRNCHIPTLSGKKAFDLGLQGCHVLWSSMHPRDASRKSGD